MYTFKKYNEGKPVTWGVYSPDNELLCVCLYKRGARTITDHINAILGHIPAAAFVDVSCAMKSSCGTPKPRAAGEVANG